MQNYETLLVDIADEVATVQFNRPDKKNCMSPTLHSEMVTALNEIAAAKPKVVIITGVGDSFCGGMDLEQCFFQPFDDPERMEEIYETSFVWIFSLFCFLF